MSSLKKSTAGKSSVGRGGAQRAELTEEQKQEIKEAFDLFDTGEGEGEGNERRSGRRGRLKRAGGSSAQLSRCSTAARPTLRCPLRRRPASDDERVCGP